MESETVRALLVATTWIMIAGLGGCAAQAPVVLGLQRDRYVLPPEPPPPRPMSEQERRALEAEWPAPTSRDPFPERTIICTWDVAAYCGPTSSPVLTSGWRSRSPRYGNACDLPRIGNACETRPVLVRVVPSRCSATPSVILETR